MVTNENERQAAVLKVGISTYVSTATLAVLAGGVALFTYFQQNFDISDYFYGVMAVAAALLILSIIAGGKGSNTTAVQLAAETWTKDTKTCAFNLQSYLTLGGAIALIVAVAIGAESSRLMAKDPCVVLLSHQLAEPNVNIAQLRKDLALCEAIRS